MQSLHEQGEFISEMDSMLMQSTQDISLEDEILKQIDLEISNSIVQQDVSRFDEQDVEVNDNEEMEVEEMLRKLPDVPTGDFKEKKEIVSCVE